MWHNTKRLNTNLTKCQKKPQKWQHTKRENINRTEHKNIQKNGKIQQSINKAKSKKNGCI